MTTTYDIAALEALRERVRAATGPDKELDAEIAVFMSGDPDAVVIRDDGKGVFSHQPGWWSDGRNKSHRARSFSASLDACAALQAEVLPNTSSDLRKNINGPSTASLIEPVRNVWFIEVAPTLPLAYLAAILSALIAMHREAV